MAQEIEKKFLVEGAFKKHLVKSTRIVQGYLSSVPERTVRVRLKGDKGFLTIKGIGDATGASRFEWESEISKEAAQNLLNICEPGIIDKMRHLIKAGRHTFEVDEFYGDNEGLILAEIELDSIDEDFEKPDWLGKEVTGMFKYYNAMLKKEPFKNWE